MLELTPEYPKSPKMNISRPKQVVEGPGYVPGFQGSVAIFLL